MCNGGLLPGKVVPSHKVCYVAWGGAEHGLAEYEVSRFFFQYNIKYVRHLILRLN